MIYSDISQRLLRKSALKTGTPNLTAKIRHVQHCEATLSAWWQRHTGVNDLSRVVSRLWNGRDSDPWALNCKTNHV